MPEVTVSPFLTVAEAATYLRLKKHTLDNMRWQGTGPRFRKHGGRIVYHQDDLKTWSEGLRRRSTSGRTD
ncbi:MAG TPA: helix-turn-helix domain-containing protein [Hyphomicrobium sp.]|nr:helix-turn-helix domain-containing protein [Hyphomicrobium sp.]